MVVIVIVIMPMGVIAVVDVLVHMRRAVGVRMGMAVGIGDLAIVAVRMFVIVRVAVLMHRAVGMDMAVRVRPALDFHFAVTATANCTHHGSPDSYSMAISRTRISVPAVGCTWWLPQTGQAP